MIVDLLLVALLGAVWVGIARPRWRDLWRTFVGRAAAWKLRSPLLWLLGCSALVSAGGWAQAVHVLGPWDAWALLSGGPSPFERLECHRRLQALRSGSAHPYFEGAPLGTCPCGGGAYVEKLSEPTCPLHGKAP